MKKLITGLLVLGSFSALAQDLTIKNSTYPEQKIDLYCQDVDCSRMSVEIYRQVYDYRTGKTDDIVEKFEIDKSTIETTAKNRRKFSKFKFKNIMENPYEITGITAEAASTAYKEGAYASSAFTSLVLPLTAAMETAWLPIGTLTGAIDELIRNKRVDASSEKKAAKRILTSLNNVDVTEAGYKHVKYVDIRNYISKIAKLNLNYLELVDNYTHDFAREFNYKTTNCLIKSSFYMKENNWYARYYLYVGGEQIEEYSKRDNLAEAVRYIDSGECKTKN